VNILWCYILFIFRPFQVINELFIQIYGLFISPTTCIYLAKKPIFYMFFQTVVYSFKMHVCFSVTLSAQNMPVGNKKICNSTSFERLDLHVKWTSSFLTLTSSNPSHPYFRVKSHRSFKRSIPCIPLGVCPWCCLIWWCALLLHLWVSLCWWWWELYCSCIKDQRQSFFIVFHCIE